MGKLLSIFKSGLHGLSFYCCLLVQNHLYSHKYIQTSALQENLCKLYCSPLNLLHPKLLFITFCVYMTHTYVYIINKLAYSPITTIWYTPPTLLIPPVQTYCELFIGLLVINILLPLTLCPGTFPFRSWLIKYELPLTSQPTPGLTSQVSSIGKSVTPGWYMTTPGSSTIVEPTRFV